MYLWILVHIQFSHIINTQDYLAFTYRRGDMIVCHFLRYIFIRIACQLWNTIISLKKSLNFSFTLKKKINSKNCENHFGWQCELHTPINGTQFFFLLKKKKKVASAPKKAKVKKMCKFPYCLLLEVSTKKLLLQNIKSLR